PHSYARALHDALPISLGDLVAEFGSVGSIVAPDPDNLRAGDNGREQSRLVERYPLPRGLQRGVQGVPGEHNEVVGVVFDDGVTGDRKSTRLNSSHVSN